MSRVCDGIGFEEFLLNFAWFIVHPNSAVTKWLIKICHKLDKVQNSFDLMFGEHEHMYTLSDDSKKINVTDKKRALYKLEKRYLD